METGPMGPRKLQALPTKHNPSIKTSFMYPLGIHHGH